MRLSLATGREKLGSSPASQPLRKEREIADGSQHAQTQDASGITAGRTTVSDIQFPGSSGEPIAATVELPADDPRAVALMAHCFTCGRNSHATSRISRALADRGYAVMRFDFTGLGDSDGDFGDTNFTTNVADLVLAAGWLAHRVAAPSLLVGHSLGGAAVIAATGQLPTVRAVATIGAPAHPNHVQHLVAGGRPSPEGRLMVNIGGRPFAIAESFMEDIASQPQAQRLADLTAALLVMHAPTDQIVGIDNARDLFDAARHPKSFVALDGADHLLSRAGDAQYAADIIAAWSSRYLTADTEAAR